MYYSGENCSVQAIDHFHAWWFVVLGSDPDAFLLNIKRGF